MTDAAPGRVLPDLLSSAADRAPEREAVRCRDRSLTYGELDRAADAVASALVDAGVGLGDRVGIHAPKRAEILAIVYGAMRAGAAYVPIDPKAPAARAAEIATDCRIAALATTSALLAPLGAAMSEHTPSVTILLDEDAPNGERTTRLADLVRAGGARPDVRVRENDLAYILYTSGSTGVPKGVMLTHGNALAFARWAAATVGAGADDRISNHAPLHFDLSVFDLYVAAIAGAAVVLVPEEVAFFARSMHGLITEERISVWYSVPSALMLLARSIREPGELSSLRSVVFAGEVFPTSRLRGLRTLLPRVELWNLYGPTETNVVTYHHVGELPVDDRPIPIGRACEGTTLLVVGDDGAPIAPGVLDRAGELYVSGPTVMRGYWERPELTVEVLAPMPDGNGSLGYRTGDLVRWRPDGELDFLGRRDHQVKSRGYRIELGDIEAAMTSCPGVEEAVVIHLPHPEWGIELVGFVAPSSGADLTPHALKRHVAQRLPRYMVPTDMRIVERLPRSSNGKVDRPALARRESDRRAAAGPDAAR